MQGSPLPQNWYETGHQSGYAQAAHFASGVPSGLGLGGGGGTGYTNSLPPQAGGGGARAPVLNKLGTQISSEGIITVRTLVDDIEIAFSAVRDTVRFLASLYPDFSYPALISGQAFQPGATYKLEHYERKKLEGINNETVDTQIRKIKKVTIKEIVNENAFKILNYEVDNKIEGDFVELFPPTTYISVEIVVYPYDQSQTQMTLTMNGGPPDIETTYCCLCLANPGSVHMQQESQDARPGVYKQANKFIEYVKTYDPNTSLAQQVTMSQSPTGTPMQRKFSSNSAGGKNGSKLGLPVQVTPGLTRTPRATQPQPMPRTPRTPKSPFNSSNGIPQNGYGNMGNRSNVGNPNIPPSPNHGYAATQGSNMNNSVGMGMRGISPYGAPPGPPPQNMQQPMGGIGMPMNGMGNISGQNLKFNAAAMQQQGGHADEIAKLFDLFKAGALTKEEFEIEKKKIIVNQRKTPMF